MRSIAEIDRDHEGMYDACVRQPHGCTYPVCKCDRSQREIPNVRGVGGPKLTPEQIASGVSAGQQPAFVAGPGFPISGVSTWRTGGPDGGVKAVDGGQKNG